MASPTYPVYEGYGIYAPKRPTAAADLGGLDFSDSLRLPPKNRVELASTDYMQSTMSLERIARMAPTLMADMVLVTSGAPVPATGISCVNNNVLAADVVITNTATGKYTIAYPANKLPSPNMHPIAVIVYGAAVIASLDTLNHTASSIDVWTYDPVGVLSGSSVTICLRVY